MMSGTVVNRRPIVPMVVRGRSGQGVAIEALLDTGFTGFLTLPAPLVANLGLPFRNYFRAGLADGSVVRLAVHAAAVLWHGTEQDIEVLVTNRPPLLGTALLSGHEVIIRFAEGDTVSIQTL